MLVYPVVCCEELQVLDKTTNDKDCVLSLCLDREGFVSFVHRKQQMELLTTGRMDHSCNSMSDKNLFTGCKYVTFTGERGPSGPTHPRGENYSQLSADLVLCEGPLFSFIASEQQKHT